MNLNQAHTKWSLWGRYAAAISIFSLALLLRFWVLPVQSGVAFLTFYPATVICFYLCGIGPGVLMVMLSALAGHYIFSPPYWSFADNTHGIPVAVFLFSAFLIGHVINQLQRYGEELQQHKQYYLNILEDQDEVICRFKKDGSILYVNDAFCNLFGKSRDALLGHTWHPEIHPDDLALVNVQLSTLSPESPVVTIENRIITKNGVIRWGQFTHRAIFDAANQLLEIQTVGRDITDRKLSEIALQRESEKNQMLLRNASDGIHILDVDGNIIEVSDSFCRMMGYSRDEMIGMNVTQWDASLDQNEIRKVFKQQFAHPVRSQFERRHCRKDGSCFDVEISGFPLQLEGKPVIFNSSRDISERKHFEEALRDHEERLSLATLHNGVGIWDWNLQTQEMVWDDSMYALYHIRREDFSGTEEAWRQSLHPDDLKRGDKEVDEALAGIKPFNTEFRVCWPTGEIRYIKAVAKVFRDEQGKPIRMLGTNIDITDRKLLQMKLERQAHTDYLTEVSNRRYFMEQAELELSRSIRYHNPLSVLMMDIDFFKRINDSHGHKVGDAVLKKLAEVCRETLREIDMVGRMGGEEFAVLLPETAGNEAVEAVERLRIAIVNAKVPLENGLPIHFTVSMGVASLASKDDNIDVLLSQADEALYEAKESGRNKVCLARQSAQFINHDS